MTERKKTPLFIFFYLLFSPDTWRGVLGILIVVIAGPLLSKNLDLPLPGSIVFWFMIGVIGWWVTEAPANFIAGFLKKRIIGKIK
ncbi:MAG: hypothetical protein K9L30_00105 [Desulfobacterales bacterium]|nr:hypothetical protein [Desulfobacterales bacterium]